MTILSTKEAAAMLGYKNHKSLFRNKVIPRHHRGGRVGWVKEEIEQWIHGESLEVPVVFPETRRLRIKARW